MTPVSPSRSRPWARWVVLEESRGGGGMCFEGTEGAYLGSSAGVREAAQTSLDPCGPTPGF